jgi:hypothetical protein
MDNPEKLAILGTKDTGGRQTKLKTHHRKLRVLLRLFESNMLLKCFLHFFIF